jgi:hypothetical protein
MQRQQPVTPASTRCRTRGISRADPLPRRRIHIGIVVVRQSAVTLRSTGLPRCRGIRRNGGAEPANPGPAQAAISPRRRTRGFFRHIVMAGRTR